MSSDEPAERNHDVCLVHNDDVSPDAETRPKDGPDIRPGPLTVAVPVQDTTREWGGTTELAMPEMGDDGDEDAIDVTTTRGSRLSSNHWIMARIFSKGFRIG